jgi:hypothetical protein
MKFFFPDSQDLVDPSFDFEKETRSTTRLRQRDDLYAHEVFGTPAHDGLLVSKGIVDGFGETSSRYSQAQRHRLLRTGAPEFFRLHRVHWGPVPVIGDCGAFTYVRESKPPYSVDEVLDFYDACQFDFGIAVDHVILAYQPAWDHPGAEGGAELAQAKLRQEITLELAAEFLAKHRRRGLKFEPLGVAQGWSPASYASAVSVLQKIGYRYIALGGMVPLKTSEILDSLKAVAGVRIPEVRLHLLGVTRIAQLSEFARFGVASFDSTSPLRQAFKDEKDNYYTSDRTYTAIRVPQVEGNARLQKLIRAGEVNQEAARRNERACLEKLAAFDAGNCSLTNVLSALRSYEEIYDPKHNHTEVYREVLEDKPWKRCPCDICRQIGHHVILFRGAERNRRRGFHNIWVFYRRLKREIAEPGAMNSRRDGKRQLELLARSTNLV